MGTRLRSVCSDLPKPMAVVQGKPFLHHLMAYWKEQGVTRFILSVGYLAEKIISYFGKEFQAIPIEYSIEKEPLGTGGGLLHALPLLLSLQDPFLVLNGDTLFQVPLKNFNLQGDLSLSLRLVEENHRYDGVTLAPDGQVIHLKANAPLINGGVYFFHRNALSSFETTKALSLEKEILPYFIKKGTCFGQCFDQFFIDIGIPEDYYRAQLLL